MTVLAEQEWRARQDAHYARVRQWTGPHRERQARGVKHPVLDFMFTYYSHRPARFERWHPGLGVTLEGAREFLDLRGYAEFTGGVALDPAELTEARRGTAEFVHGLLSATASRRPKLGCFGLHEWAMVYRTDDVRHAEWPLRLGPQRTDEVVESLPLRCSHFDAFRFFTEDAVPRNAARLSRERQADFEQPGCLHATMDLYKWTSKLERFLPSELIADCFELALDARELDMRASPYDLSDLGYPPVRIETETGRAEYARAQAALAERAEPLRHRVIDACAGLLTGSFTARAGRAARRG
jgi:hypothetical protein